MLLARFCQEKQQLNVHWVSLNEKQGTPKCRLRAHEHQENLDVQAGPSAAEVHGQLRRVQLKTQQDKVAGSLKAWLQERKGSTPGVQLELHPCGPEAS